jgi:hypothetical protein
MKFNLNFIQNQTKMIEIVHTCSKFEQIDGETARCKRNST